MSEFQLAAESRTDTGKGAARRVRAAGRVPAVLYGHGIKPEHLSIDAREFGQALRSGGANALLELRVGRRRHLALAREVQRHPVRGSLTHVDFLVVRRGEKVTVQVPVRLVGEAPGVVQGGILDQDLHQLNVEAEVTAVPEAIDADVSGLQIGDVLRAGDLKAPAGATILDDPEAPVVSVVAPTVEPVEAEEEEGAEAAEPEAAEAPEGAPETSEGREGA
ncbi:MAG TPA: 50S ribosomal protein L25/general stress protein Ctc [Actinomycetota bacterium]|jgi:large subunit ribosomal protein L25|nr:50S ribosomal protein L25/general stress protein Ctc [Actinomycetota bacterium]